MEMHSHIERLHGALLLPLGASEMPKAGYVDVSGRTMMSLMGRGAFGHKDSITAC